MMALEPLLADRVRAALAALPAAPAWSALAYSAAGRRDALPLASVRVDTAQVTDSRTGAVNVQPGITVALATKRGPDAAAQIDSAFAATIAAVHNWRPGQVAGRAWNPLALQQVSPLQYLATDGLVGLELTFTTHARFDGQT